MDALEIISGNLRDTDSRIARSYECRLAHIREKADQAALRYGTEERFFLADDAFRKGYAEWMKDAEAVAEAGTPKESHSDLADLFSFLRNAEAIYFCRVLLAHFRAAHEKQLTAEDFCPYEESADAFAIRTDRIAYLKNVHTDMAFNQFQRVLPDSAVSYCDDFQQVCEEVSSGRAKYGILPIESSADGRLKRFRTLLDRFDLKIVLTCDVGESDGVTTRFALFGRAITTIDCGRYRAASYFECKIGTDAETDLPCILEAAAYFGLKLFRADTVPAVRGGEFAFDLVFLSDSGDLPAFLCYLTLEHPRFLPLGAYTGLRRESRS